MVAMVASPPYPLLCSSATNAIIGAKDHASVQINVAKVRRRTPAC